MAENDTINSSTAVEDEDDVITLEEAIQSEQALIADANAVLGACDEKNCTYSQVRNHLSESARVLTPSSMSPGLSEPAGSVCMSYLHSRS